MKKIFSAILGTAMLFSAPVFADLEVPGETNPVLARETFKTGNLNLEIVKKIEHKTVTLQVKTAEGKDFWASAPLGDQEKLFIIDDAAASLKARDLTGDGVPEIIVAAMTSEMGSALYVFKLDEAAKGFTAMNFKYKDADLVRDFVVSDMYQKSGHDLVVTKDNQIQALGKIYSEENGPTPGFYFFGLAGESFICSKVEPVPGGN